MKYSIINNEEVNELSLAFLNSLSNSNESTHSFIKNLLDILSLSEMCKNISIDNNPYSLASYNYPTKQIRLNTDLITKKLSSISNDKYFIKSNLCRIVLHEIKHVLQYKMLKNKDNDLYKLFDCEFNLLRKQSLIKPSEINADIESSLLILNLYTQDNCTYYQQLGYTLNLINQYCNTKLVSQFCETNNINIELSKMDELTKFIYGFENNKTKIYQK